MRAAGLMGVWLVAGCIPGLGNAPSAPPPASPPAATPRAGALSTDGARPAVRRPDRTDDDATPQAGTVATLPAPPPAWEARPVSPDAVEIAPTSYLVRPGDTLRGIADRTGAGLEAIAQANGIVSPYVVRSGQRLRIPGGRFHLVRPGQSGIAIARAYGVPWRRIIAENTLAEPYVLRAGQRILIPGEQGTPASRAAERAAAFTLDIDEILTGGEPALASNQAPARPVATPRRVLPTSAVVAPPARLAGGGFAWPVDGRVVKRFGPGASGERNDGIKIAVPLRTPIRAAADGVVAYAGDGIAALGGLVMVKHGGGWTSIYGHAARLQVQRGQAVKRGDIIALSGDTGFADRPELHFELRRGRTPVDPQSQLPRS